jgi:hypothetical protein
VAALQVAQLVVADAGAYPEVGDALLAPCGGMEERDHLVARHPVDLWLAHLRRPRCRAGLLSRGGSGSCIAQS